MFKFVFPLWLPQGGETKKAKVEEIMIK